MFADILWRFLILKTSVVGALYCTCDDVHSQTHFCTSEFVLKVKIHETNQRSMHSMLLLEIKKVFKGDVRRLKFIQTRFVILEMLGGCHVEDMKHGNKFVIFGNNQDGNIFTHMCYGNMRWENTTVFFRHALSKYYKRNCDCYPEPNYLTTQKHCKSKYSFMRKRGTDCKWVNTRYFRLCEKGWLNGRYWK